MIIDFHVHGKIKKTFPFDKEAFLLTVKEAKENGLDGLAITEHCQADNFSEGYEFLNSNYKQIEDYYDINGFRVFYGMEVTTQQKLDILIIGTPQKVIQLRSEIIVLLKGKRHIDINDLFTIPRINEFLVILAHPYREYLEFPELETNVISKIDAMEFNAKDLYNKGIENMKDKVSKLADKCNLPIVCGSDTHYFIQMSTAKNVFLKNPETVEGIKKEIKCNNYEIQLSNDLQVRVKSAIIIKELICNK